MAFRNYQIPIDIVIYSHIDFIVARLIKSNRSCEYKWRITTVCNQLLIYKNASILGASL